MLVSIHYNRLNFPRATLRLPDERTFTQHDDKQVVLWLAGMSDRSGAIVELGCSDGQTLAELAISNPSRICVGVDDGKPHGRQDNEVPEGLPGWKAAGLPNVQVCPVETPDFAWPEDVTFAFIDASHEYADVKRDTLAAMAAMQRHGKLSVIAWHDYYDQDQPLKGAEWMGVGRWVRELAAEQAVIGRVHGTSVAWMVVNPVNVRRDIVIIPAPAPVPDGVMAFRSLNADALQLRSDRHIAGEAAAETRDLARHLTHYGIWQLAGEIGDVRVLEGRLALSPEDLLFARLWDGNGLAILSHPSEIDLGAYLVDSGTARKLVRSMGTRFGSLNDQLNFLRAAGQLTVTNRPYL